MHLTFISGSEHNQILRFGKNLVRNTPGLHGRVSLCNENGEGSPLEPMVALQACRESFRWGEPILQWQDDEHLLLGIALSLNQRFCGGVLIHHVPQPETDSSEISKNLHVLGARYMNWLGSRNHLNESLMLRHRQQGNEERLKAEAIHELKADSNLELRTRFSHSAPDLILAVKRGDRPEARKLLNLLIMQVYNLAGNDFLQVRTLLAELVALLRTTAREYDPDPEQEDLYSLPYWETLKRIEDEEDLSAWLRKMLEATMDLIESSAVSPGKVRAHLILDYMRRNISHPLPRNHLARKAGLSEAEFSRMMKRETGKPFSWQLNSLRIDEACRLLRKSSLSIQEVAYACGFEEASYFSNVFKKWTGKSPSAFRKAE